MLESRFKTRLIGELHLLFPGCVVIHTDPTDIQGIPDLIVLYKNHWGALEGKQTLHSSHRPNQDYYVDSLDRMSFARFICPENKEEVLYALQRSFEV